MTCPLINNRIDETHRPVRLRRVVLGYPDATTEFKFDLTLNYKISGIIQCYSEQKPTLVVLAAAASALCAVTRFVAVLCYTQRHPTGSQYFGKRCTICYECRTQAEVISRSNKCI